MQAGAFIFLARSQLLNHGLQNAGGEKSSFHFILFFIYITQTSVFSFFSLFTGLRIYYDYNKTEDRKKSHCGSHVLMNKSAAEPSRDKRRSMADTIDENEYFREYIYIRFWTCSLKINV